MYRIDEFAYKNKCMDKIEKVISLLNGCKSILFITGAGISAESGLPTYRGIGGLYNDKATEDGIPIEMALAGETLQNHPEITWKYLLKIEQRCRQATYNRAHEVIAQMEQHFKRVWVLTQNIDGFHQRAGSKNVVDIHGDAHKLVCPSCGWHAVVDDYRGVSIPPLCPECKNIVRPDVVFFGEMLPADKTQLLMRELEIGFDIYIYWDNKCIPLYKPADIICKPAGSSYRRDKSRTNACF